MRDLVEKVKKWGLDRNIVFTGTEGQDRQKMMEAQARKTLEETAELLDAYAKQDIDKTNDAIGDILVTLIVGASSDESIFWSVIDVLSFDRVNFEKPDGLSAAKHLVDAVVLLINGAKTGHATWKHYDRCIDALFLCLFGINSEYKQFLMLEDCLELAYNEIKNRTGRVVNGQFIKDK